MSMALEAMKQYRHVRQASARRNAGTKRLAKGSLDERPECSPFAWSLSRPLQQLVVSASPETDL